MCYKVHNHGSKIAITVHCLIVFPYSFQTVEGYQTPQTPNYLVVKPQLPP